MDSKKNIDRLFIGKKFINEFQINETIYNNFKCTFQDFNPLHISKEYAISKGFKDKVMQGNILNGFISNFIGEKFPLKNVIIHKQNIKFSYPVYLNDNLQLHSEIINLHKELKIINLKYYFLKDRVKVAFGNIQLGVI